MFFKTISYLIFLLKSTNQHGVHSPFVYQFVTNGLYQKRKKDTISIKYPALKSLKGREKKVLSNIIQYFNINKISFDFKDFTENLDKEYHVFFLKLSDDLILPPLDHLTSKHFVIVSDIYKNKKTNVKWQEIIKKEAATVTVNLFYFGIIFFRKEQAKEHFNIRV
tara:strand:- start:2223 stop:2717 length:495 start_codon:yes stop_codon:yes gene_type:complete